MSADYGRRILPGSASLALFFALWVVCGSSVATVSFERTYGGSDVDHSHSVQQTADGGYILSGCTRTFGAGLDDVYLLKTDSLGDTVWTRTFGGGEIEFGFSVQQTQDGGYVIAGLTCSYDLAGDVWLLKLDASGDTAWTRTYGGGEYDIGISVQQTYDMGYVIAGLTYSFGADSGDMYVVRTDSVGDTLWTRNHGSVHKEFGRSIQQTQDGGYILAGYTGPFTGGPYDMYLVRMNSIGDTVWTHRYGGVNSEYGYSVQETSDRGYVLAGNTSSFGAGGYDTYLVKTDSLGSTLWARTYGGSEEEDQECHVQQTSDGGYIVASTTTSFGAGLRDIYLVKTDSVGDTIWTRTYGGGQADNAFCVQQTEDGGYVVSGGTYSFGAGSQDVYLIKTDGTGFVGARVDAAILSIDAPPDTVRPDSTYGVTATVRNLGNILLTFDAVAVIDGYEDTVRVNDLAPDSSAQVSFQNWQVPPADSAVYSMNVCVYADDDVDTTNDYLGKEILAYSPTYAQESPVPLFAEAFRLSDARPNPLRHSTLISYSLPQVTQAALAVYDITGRLVETLVNETQQPGIHRVTWNRTTNPSGVYFYHLMAGELISTKKMVVID